MKFLGFGKKKNGAKKRKAVLDKTTLVPNASIPEPAVADNSPERVSENVPDESGGLTKVHSKEFGTPVVAGSGDLPTTPVTEAETPSPVLASLNVVSQRDEESLEIVIQGIVTDQPLVDESPLAVEVTPSEDVPDYQEEEEEEEPFDQAEFRGPEDPTILDFEKAASKELHAIKDDDDEPPPPPPPLPEALARRLLGAFNCESSTTMDASRRIMESFYDNMCGTELHKRSSKRPYFNREFTLTFIKVRIDLNTPQPLSLLFSQLAHRPAPSFRDHRNLLKMAYHCSTISQTRQKRKSGPVDQLPCIFGWAIHMQPN